jgi:flagellar biosynthesis protein FliP
MFQTNDEDEIKINISCLITFFRKSSRYEKMWKNMVQPYRPHDMAQAHCLLEFKATNTLTEYVIFIAFARQQRLH